MASPPPWPMWFRMCVFFARATRKDEAALESKRQIKLVISKQRFLQIVAEEVGSSEIAEVFPSISQALAGQFKGTV